MGDKFEKELPSDVDDVTALPLLDDLSANFQEEDLQLMLEVFSILKMKAGDRLIAAGEYASFVGIILQGTFHAHVTPTLKVPLKPGDTLGEMSLFEGGDRNADVYTGTDEEGCILAILTYNDLDQISDMERYASLARKLRNLFATASIQKLRKMINNKPASSSTPAAGDAAGSAAPAPARESLFTQKLGPAAATPATPAKPAASATSAATPAAAPAGDAAKDALLSELNKKLAAKDAVISNLQDQVAKLTVQLATRPTETPAATAAPTPAKPAAAAATTPAKPAAATATTPAKPAASPAAAAKKPVVTVTSPVAAKKPAAASPAATKSPAAGAKVTVAVKKPAAK